MPYYRINARNAEGSIDTVGYMVNGGTRQAGLERACLFGRELFE